MVSLGAVFVFSVFMAQPATNIAPNPGLGEQHAARANKNADFGLPVRLKIPALKINAPIAPVGTTPEGDMESPKGPDDVGWYKPGPHPGNTGTAVLAGHYGRWIDGRPSVFDNLHKLKTGDIIYTIDANGASAAFVVRGQRTYGQNEEAQDVFVSKDGQTHLNLITCEGDWSEAEQTYSKRLVVFADGV